MPLANKNYVTPAWIDNAAPPINDDELNAISETVEGSQILGGNGAPPTTPKSPQLIPKCQSVSDLASQGYSVAYNEAVGYYFHVGSDDDHDVKVSVYDYGDYWIRILFTCETDGAIVYCLKGPNDTRVVSAMVGPDPAYPGINSNNLTFSWPTITPQMPTTVYAPVYASYEDAMAAALYPPAPFRIGQRYADVSTTPPTMYELVEDGFPGQPIPKMQTKAELTTDGYLVAYYGENREEIRVGSDNLHEVTVVAYERIIGYVAIVFACMSPGAQAYITYPELTTGGGVTSVSLTLYNEDTGLYYWNTRIPASNPHDNQAPWYFTLQEALAKIKNQPATWEQVQDPNRNMAQEYSTGSSYAAGDCCIYGGWLYKALEATSGAWDGSKWERVRYADELSSHVSDKDNPHSVTAAQTGAASPPVLATVQETPTAVRDYYAGDYFIYEGQLYALKENVEQGGDLFGPRTPETVSVYDMNTYYPVSAHSTPYAGAAITESGLELRQYRERNQVPISSGAKYFFWIDTKNGIVRYTMYSSDRDELQDITQTSPVLFITYGYEVRKQGDQFGFTVGGPGPDPKQAGELYYRTSAGPFDIQNHYRWLWPDDSVMFRGTEEEMVQFLSGIARYKKSEPAALGDGVTALYPKVGAVTISTFWGGSGPYSQTVTVTGADVTGKSKIDLTPTAAQLSQLTADGVLSLTIENVGGTLTAWAVGAQPSGAMTISCVVRETV